ncbi:hypothetical protein [Pelosinus sp. IPA-1]|uniref:hypothetical protein n=1 Tax=Pelosinus sp. IPA-1 TaxID=3029569 RepID=UPI0024361C65|nr:hypothetical protein [Pelosinus sp. IPA-1]GMB01220.1 hypothetical protein PIPA1_40190 [Pelosinus sp. IPA-1]
MQSKIIPFPTQVENPCEEIERHIRMYLAEITADKDFINYVSNRMRDYIENYACKSFEPTFNLVVPPNLSREQADALLLSLDKGVKETAEEVQDMVGKIIMERLQLEIEIYASQQDIKYRLC